jgi:hypothetical protein
VDYFTVPEALHYEEHLLHHSIITLSQEVLRDNYKLLLTQLVENRSKWQRERVRRLLAKPRE